MSRKAAKVIVKKGKKWKSATTSVMKFRYKQR
jgi:hypothetical protein